MKKNPFYALPAFLLLIINTAAGQVPAFHENVYYYIENEKIFEINQVRGHVPMVRFDNPQEALINDWNSSRHFKSLNGQWQFHYADTPEQAPADFFRPEYNTSGWDLITVPSNWQMQGYGHPKFRNIAHPFPSNPPKVPRGFNPVGSYRTTFTLDPQWDGQQVYLRFEGIRSASMVWVNGKEAGYNQGAFEPSEYNITSLLKEGENLIAVKVFQWSDGTYLEGQDMWRLGGIFRDAYLYAMPGVHIRDYYIVTDLDAQYKDAILNIEADIINMSTATAGGYSIRATLYDNSHQMVSQSQQYIERISIGNERKVKLTTPVTNPLKWSAEKPNLYHLTLELIKDGEATAVLSSRVGFREVEVKNQAILVNGVAVKLNGINSHMQHPELGNTMNEETIRKDFEIMKQFNINCVRTSHYPPHKMYLHLADEYGLYIIDEAGVEAHATEYLSDREEWLPVYLDRVRKLVLRDRNHPSVIMWSAGNESGWGDNLCRLISEGRSLDASRPAWMYGGNSDENPASNPIQCEEIVGPRYGTPFELETLFASVTPEEDPRPSFMDEYLAATGNALGGLDEYWELIWKYPRLTGGAIWDFVSPGIREPVRLLQDKSPTAVNVAVMGRPVVENGYINLTGHDEWVEVYRHPSLDITSDQLTLFTRINPGTWNNNGSWINKGSHQFGLRQLSPDSLEFYLTTGKRYSLKVALPTGWVNNWHDVAAVYDGQSMMIYTDGVLLGEKACQGNISNYPFPVNIGRNAEVHGQEYDGYLLNARIDHAAILNTAIPQNELRDLNTSLAEKSLLWLDFETETRQGDFFSMGIGGRTYGTIWPDRTIQPEMWQIKKSAQPVKVEWVSHEQGLIKITNRFNFTNINELDAEWFLLADDRVLDQGKIIQDIAPGQSMELNVPFNKPVPQPSVEYRLEISFKLKNETQWAPQGHEVAWEQLELPWSVTQDAPTPASSPAPTVTTEDDLLVVKGTNFTYTFSKVQGTIISMAIDGKEYLKEGPVANVWRAPLANETDAWPLWRSRDLQFTPGMGNGISNTWQAAGLDNLTWETSSVDFTTTPDNKARIEMRVWARATGFGAGFSNRFIYLIDGNGVVEIDHTFTPWGVLPSWIPRVGLQMILPKDLNKITWYGRGPFENYPDRKTGARIGIYNTTAEQEYQPYLIPQDHGLKTDVRWVRFADESGKGLHFSGDNLFNYNALIYDTDNLSRAWYPFQLLPSDGITFNYDYSTSGVGCTSFTVYNRYKTKTTEYKAKIKIEPF